MEALKKLDAQCGLCYTKFDPEKHASLVLECCHSICSVSLEKLWVAGTVKCPYCRRVSRYKSKSTIPRNPLLVDLHNSVQYLEIIQFEPIKKMISFIQK